MRAERTGLRSHGGVGLNTGWKVLRRPFMQRTVVECKHRGAIYWEVDLYSAEGKASRFEIEKVVNDKRYGYCTQW